MGKLLGLLLVIASAVAVLPAGGRAVSTEGSVEVVVIPGFKAPHYDGFAGVPQFPKDAAPLARFHFSQLAASAVTPAALKPYDTIVLYGVRWATLPSSAQAAINSFAQTGKILIWDADATGSQSYSTFIHAFSTTAAGEVPARKNGSVVSFSNGGDPLASPDPKSPAYLDPAVLIGSYHLVDDMTVMNPGAAGWAPSLIAANETLPSGGWLVSWTYGSTSDHTGAVIYSGMDADAFGDPGSTNYALKELALELAFPVRRSAESCAPSCSAGGGGSGSGLGASGNRTFAKCSIAAAPKNWVHGRVVYWLKVSVASGIHGEIRSRTGKSLASALQQDSTPGKLRLPLNTKLLPSNRRAALDLLVYVNSEKACTLQTTVKVDNTPPRLLSHSLRRQNSGWKVTGRPTESVKFSVFSHGHLLRAVLLARARPVSLSFPKTRTPTAVVLRDRAGNTDFISLSTK